MADELVLLTGDLYTFVESSEPFVSRARRIARADKLCAWADELSERFAMARAKATRDLASTVDETIDNLKAIVAELVAKRPGGPEYKSRWKSLGYNYESLILYIRRLHLPVPGYVQLGRIKPLNYSRNFFHAFNGVLGIVLYEFFWDRFHLVMLSGGILVLFILMELSRRISTRINRLYIENIFAKVVRPNEVHEMPSSICFVAALCVGTALLPQHAIELGVLILAFADPAATLAGKRWGTKRLYADKTVVGTVAFLITALVLGVMFLRWVRPELGWATTLGLVLIVSGVGALAELLGRHVEDNFSIPLLSGGVAALLL